MDFTSSDDLDFFMHFSEKLQDDVYERLLKNEHKTGDEPVSKKSPQVWQNINKKDFVKNFGSCSHLYFYKHYRVAARGERVSFKNDTLSAALNFLGINVDANLSLKTKLKRQIAAYREKYAIPSSDIYSEKNPEAPKRKQPNILEVASFKNLIGFTGTENVYTIVRRIYSSHKKLDNVNLYDSHTSSIIMNLLEEEQVRVTQKQVHTNEKQDQEATRLDPYEIIAIGDNDIFIVVGLYGYNLLPDLSQDSHFFQSLLFKWEDKVGETEFTTLYFKGSSGYTVIYEDLEKNSGGISHGVFAKVKYKEYTYIQCGGVGQLGTDAMGSFIKQNWKSIYELIFSKSSNPHSYAVLFELNLNDPSKSRILDSVVLTIS